MGLLSLARADGTSVNRTGTGGWRQTGQYASRMANIPEAGREAIEFARLGDVEQAIARARQAIESHPQDAGLRAFLAMLHIRRNELAEAVPHFRAALAIGPADPLLVLELIRVLIALGELDEAEAQLNEVRLPGIESVRLRAMLLQRRGETGEAGKLFQQVVETDPRDFESWGNLGICLLAVDQPKQAIAAFAQSLVLRPDRLSIRQKWVEAHFIAGTAGHALNELRKLAQTAPKDAGNHVAIAHAEKLLGRPRESFASIEEAVRRDSANTDALVALAEAVEHRNDLERFESILATLTRLNRQNEKIPLLRARLAFRRGDYEQALALARSAAPSTDTGTRAQIIGQCLDGLGYWREAFDSFVEMNREDARTGASTSRVAEESRASLSEQRELLTPDWFASWRHVPVPQSREPAFIVGFPRSGTTLLDTLLMGHPGTAVAEEEPMLASVAERIGELPRVANLEERAVEDLRTFYFDEAQKHVPNARESLLIDKNPLVMGMQAIVHRLFPTAPIIFMERHPCDVVLSCFMTRFQPTGFGANFLTVEDTARLYDEEMRLWTRSVETLPLRTHIVRYERLVEDLEAELRPVAQFLGLDWLPQLLDHRATARKRTFIKTPSYSQVTEPVNSRAVGRWTHYREQLEPVFPILEPWVRRMGYVI